MADDGRFLLDRRKVVRMRGKGVFVAIKQTDDKFVANCTYKADDGAEVHWRARGAISKGGEMTANLKHMKPEGYKSQTRTAKLDPDGENNQRARHVG